MELDFFSARRMRTCSWTLRALAPGSGDGPSEGTMYAVQDVAGCRADRKQLSATAALISGGGLEPAEEQRSGLRAAVRRARCLDASAPVSAAKWRWVGL